MEFSIPPIFLFSASVSEQCLAVQDKFGRNWVQFNNWGNLKIVQLNLALGMNIVVWGYDT